MRRNKQESHHRLGDWQAKCRQSLVVGMHFGLHIISRFSCSTSLRLSVKSLPANLIMDGSDPTNSPRAGILRASGATIWSHR